MKDIVTVIIKNVPRETREAFKAACAFEGVTMQSKLIEFMESVAKEVRR